MEKQERQRTNQQSRAMHLAFNQISQLLIEQGIDQRTIVQDLEGYSAPVTPEFLKQVFKTIMYTMYRKTSTSDLTTNEMTTCFDVFAHFLGEQYGVQVTWPSTDALYIQHLIDIENESMV